METKYVVTNQWAENKIGSPEFLQSAVRAVVISGCGRERRHMSAVLLGIIAIFLFGCRHSDETITSNKATLTSPNKNCPYELSPSFRDAAGDAFDKLQSLESNELQGKLFYQPAYQEAGRAVLKAQRVASSADEVKLSEIMSLYHGAINLYRVETELANRAKASEAWAAKYPDIANTVDNKLLHDNPDFRKLPDGASVVQRVFQDEENQRQNRVIIAGCLNASSETTPSSDYQSLIEADERRKLENERYWAARDAAAAASKRKVKKEPQFVDEPGPKP